MDDEIKITKSEALYIQKCGRGKRRPKASIVEDIIKSSFFSIPYVLAEFDLSRSTLYGWRKGRKPRDIEKFNAVMAFFDKEKVVEKHPSYGYATKEEIEKLRTMKKGKAFSTILERIERRIRRKGKM